jgi:hypothetical protein
MVIKNKNKIKKEMKKKVELLPKIHKMLGKLQMKDKDQRKFIGILLLRITSEERKMSFKALDCNMKGILLHIKKSHEIVIFTKIDINYFYSPINKYSMNVYIIF